LAGTQSQQASKFESKKLGGQRPNGEKGFIFFLLLFIFLQVNKAIVRTSIPRIILFFSLSLLSGLIASYMSCATDKLYEVGSMQKRKMLAAEIRKRNNTGRMRNAMIQCSWNASKPGLSLQGESQLFPTHATFRRYCTVLYCTGMIRYSYNTLHSVHSPQSLTA